MSTPENASAATPLLDPATGMKPGERYRVEPAEGGQPFEGFFLDGKYFLDADLLTAVGWLEGQRFIYDQLNGAGEPVFPDRHAGDISALNLTVTDGPVLALTPIEVAVQVDEAAEGVADGAELDGDDAAHVESDRKGEPGGEDLAEGDAEAEADTNTEADSTAGAATDAVDSECPMVRSPSNLMATTAAAFAAGLVVGFAISRNRR
ncbi:hypothetical protein [Pseudomonas sp. RP23018S]|uniref:hypothetical protein n=1 Tax=Pseudomonas sp. RP23018S TaxID=3096037 RepID=UPI003A103B0F